MNSYGRLLLAPTIALAILPAAIAQDAPEPMGKPAEERTGAQVIAPLTLPPSQFAALLIPNKKADLEQLAAKWQDELEVRATAVAQARVRAARSSNSSAKAKVQQLLSEQAAVAERYEIVVDALEAKGGDVVEHRAYLAAVASPNIIENPKLISEKLWRWLRAPDGGMRWAAKFGLFLVVLLAARFIAGMASSVVQRMMRLSRVKVTELLASFFVHTTRNLVMGLGVIVGLSVLGVPVGPFLAAMGAVGFIVGFALQDTLGNFASGVMILFYRPYDLEDAVTVGGVTGKVKAMSLVSTTLTTFDNQIVVVPNRSIWGGIITNITGSDTRRVDLTFGIGYDDDISKAQSVLERLVESHPLVLQEPQPTIRLHELADSSVNFVCRPWTNTEDYWTVYWDLTRSVKESFDMEGISIPYPQQDVHVHAMSPERESQAAA